MKRSPLFVTTTLFPILFTACLAAPESAETGDLDDSAAEEHVAESDDAISVWGHLGSLRLGGTASETQIRVATDSAGNRILVGTFSGSMTIGTGASALTSAGGTDAFVVKLSPDGSVLWSRRLGGTGDDLASSVATDGAGNILVIGEMTGPVDLGGGDVAGTSYIVKLNPCGTHIWSKGFSPVYSGSLSHPNDVAANATGTIALGCLQMGAIDYGGGHILSTGPSNLGPFVMSLAADGSFLWGHGGISSTTIEPEPVNGVAIDDAGNVAVVGDHRFDLTLGCTTHATVSYSDMFVSKLDPTGACLWSNVFGANDGLIFDRGKDIALGANGAVVVAGLLGGPGTIAGVPMPGGEFLASLTSAGAVSWVRSLGPARIAAISTDPYGTIGVAADFNSKVNVGGSTFLPAGGFDVLFARYTASNVHLWSQRYGDASDQRSTGAAFSPDGSLTLTGHFAGTVDFGGGPLASAGGTDLFAARFGNSFGPEE